eukprot:8851346-Alexandrium_andersonii.AAC.1
MPRKRHCELHASRQASATLAWRTASSSELGSALGRAHARGSAAPAPPPRHPECRKRGCQRWAPRPEQEAAPPCGGGPRSSWARGPEAARAPLGLQGGRPTAALCLGPSCHARQSTLQPRPRRRQVGRVAPARAGDGPSQPALAGAQRRRDHSAPSLGER